MSGMHFSMAIAAKEDTGIQFFPDPIPSSGIALQTYAEGLVSQMMECQCLQTSVVSTDGTFAAFISNRFLFERLPLPVDKVFVFAVHTAELALSARKLVVA